MLDASQLQAMLDHLLGIDRVVYAKAPLRRARAGLRLRPCSLVNEVRVPPPGHAHLVVDSASPEGEPAPGSPREPAAYTQTKKKQLLDWHWSLKPQAEPLDFLL